jgi:hypothetical protein
VNQFHSLLASLLTSLLASLLASILIQEQGESPVHVADKQDAGNTAINQLKHPNTEGKE